MRHDISNTQFLQAIFGDSYVHAHCTSFKQDPSAIPTGESGRCWAGGAFKDTPLIPGSNQFYCVSLFAPVDGRSRRRKVQFSGTYVIGLDDVKEKLPIEQVMKLPPPSIVIKSSLHSEQWLYLLTEPCTDASRIENLHEGLIASDLVPSNRDSGFRGTTRYLRLPGHGAVNTKAKRIKENGGTAPRCTVTEWHPERRYTLEELAAPFSVDLDAPRADKRIDGAAAIDDHPLLHTGVIKIKSIISPGRFDCTCPWVDEHTDNDDSGSALFTNDDAEGSIGYRCHHGSCDSRTGADLLRYIEDNDSGFNDRLKQWQTMRSFATVTTPSQDAVTSPVSPLVKPMKGLAGLKSLSSRGGSKKMRQQMLDDKFILKDLAILGQTTIIYAAPNAGKTLLTLWMLIESIKDGVIPGEDIFYANCDDTHKGGVEKLEIAEQHGFEMLIPNNNGFKTEMLLIRMKEMVELGEARGKIIVLDTLKKFTDLMDKKMSSQFSDIAREFTGAGGSLICFAHVNKNKGTDGESIHAGTSDIKDDSDCVYTIELLNESKGFDGGVTRTVEFRNIKSRGDVSTLLRFQYTKLKGAGYNALVASVKRITAEEVADIQQRASEEERFIKYSETIEHIKTAIINDQASQSEIESFVMETFGDARRKINSVLKEYEGRLWAVEVSPQNKHTYSLIEAPSLREAAAVSFL